MGPAPALPPPDDTRRRGPFLVKGSLQRRQMSMLGLPRRHFIGQVTHTTQQSRSLALPARRRGRRPNPPWATSSRVSPVAAEVKAPQDLVTGREHQRSHSRGGGDASAVRVFLCAEAARDFQRARAGPFLASPQTDARAVRGCPALARPGARDQQVRAAGEVTAPTTGQGARPPTRSLPCSLLRPGARRPPKPDFPTTHRVPGLPAGVRRGGRGRGHRRRGVGEGGGSRTLGCGFPCECFTVSWGQNRVTRSHTHSHTEPGCPCPPGSCPSTRLLNGSFLCVRARGLWAEQGPRGTKDAVQWTG